MDISNAIPVKIKSQIQLRDLLKKVCKVGSDLQIGVQMGILLCHYGEFLRRKDEDIEVSNMIISNEEFKNKINKLLIGCPQEVVDFVNISE